MQKDITKWDKLFIMSQQRTTRLALASMEVFNDSNSWVTSSGVARLERTRVQGFHKVPPLPHTGFV